MFKDIIINVNNVGYWAGLSNEVTPTDFLTAIREVKAAPTVPTHPVNPGVAKTAFKVQTGAKTTHDGLTYSKNLFSLAGYRVRITATSHGITDKGVLAIYGRNERLNSCLTPCEIAASTMLCYLTGQQSCQWVESVANKPNIIRYGILKYDERIMKCIVDHIYYAVECLANRHYYEFKIDDWISNCAAGWISKLPHPKWSIFYNRYRDEYECLCGAKSVSKPLDKSHALDCNPRFEQE